MLCGGAGPLVLSLILNTVWVINQTKCRRLCNWAVISQSDGHVLPVIQSRLQVSMSICYAAEWVRYANSACACVNVYVIFCAFRCTALQNVIMSGLMMNGTPRVIFILGLMIQSGFCAGLQPDVWETHYLIGSLNRRLNASRMERGHSQRSVDSYRLHTS